MRRAARELRGARDRVREADEVALPSVSTSSGVRLAPDVAQPMEKLFGHSFANVRVHDDAAGDSVAKAHEARALTVGTDLFFRHGSFAPTTQFGAEVLAHELAHVVQQSDESVGAPASPESASEVDDRKVPNGAEQEADAAASAVSRGEHTTVASGSVLTGTPQAWPWSDDEPSTTNVASADTSILSSLGSMAGSAWDSTKGAASTVYDNYQKSTDFKPAAAGEGKNIDWSGKSPITLPQVWGAGIDWMENSTKENNKKAEESVAGIPVLEQAAKASSWLSNTTTSITGGVARGVGDIGFGMANAFFHPIDALSGVEGILEHNNTVPFLGTTLKALHGGYDIATGNEKGEYGSSWGELGNHLFNPIQSGKDDTAYNSNLLRGIVAPGTKDWDQAWGQVKENPADMLARAATNVAPIVLGAAEAGGGGPKAPVVEPAPPTLRTPYAPAGVPTPAPFEPNIPVVEPGGTPPPSSARPPSSLPPEPSVPSPFTKPSPGVLPPSFELPSFPPEIPLPWDGFPGFGEWEPTTQPFPKIGPDLPPSVRPPAPAPAPFDPLPNGPPTLDAPPSAPAPNSPARPISQLDPAFGPRPIEGEPLTQRSPQVPPDVPVPKSFNPDIPGPTSGDPFAREPISVDPNGPTTARPGSSRSDVPFLDRGDPVSIPEIFRGQRMPFPAPREPIPLPPSQRLSNPTPLLPERPLEGPVRPPSLGSGGPAPSSFPQLPSFPDIDWRNWLA